MGVPACLLQQREGSVAARWGDEQRGCVVFEKGFPEWPVAALRDLHDY